MGEELSYYAKMLMQEFIDRYGDDLRAGFRINISAWIFIVALPSLLLVSTLVVFVQAYVSASKNPVQALRCE